jgi:hypothetical protein
MKYLNNYKLFESEKWKIELSENEFETKENLEFMMMDLTDLDVFFQITGKNIYMKSIGDGWYRNTGVDKGFRDYLCLRIRPDYKQIEEIIKIIENCIKYTESQGWKNSMTIEKGASVYRVNLNDIREYCINYMKSNLGTISIFLWTI